MCYIVIIIVTVIVAFKPAMYNSYTTIQLWIENSFSSIRIFSLLRSPIVGETAVSPLTLMHSKAAEKITYFGNCW